MAQDKKTFEIVINGLKESIDAVKSLNKELDILDNKLKSLQKAKIEVKVQGNTEVSAPKTKVSGNTGSSSSTDKEVQQANALAKLQQQIAQQRAKSEALVTDEYQKQYQELEKIKQSNKEVEQIQKQIASGVRDSNGQYSQTLAGQRAYLSELQKTFNSQKMGTEEWRKTADELLRVREFVKNIEQSTGDYRRNVGNYPSGAAELVQMYKEQKAAMDEANRSLNALKESMRGMAADSDEYKAASLKVQELEDKLNEATQASNDLNNELSKKIAINVGGEIQYFENATQAAGELEDQLHKLYLEGKQNTKEFNDTITTLGKVKTAITAVDTQADSFIGNARGLRETVTIMNGLSSIASLGVGLQGLFGGQNEELDESLKKFTSLTLIMNGLTTLQEQMTANTTLFAKGLNKAWDWSKKLANGLGKITGFNYVFENLGGKLANWGKGVTNVIDIDNIKKQIKEVEDALSNLPVDATRMLSQHLGSMFQELADVAAKVKIAPDTKGLESVRNIINGLTAQIDDLNAEDLRFGGAVPEIREDIEETTKELEKWKNVELKLNTGDTQGALQDINQMLDDMGNELNSVSEIADDTSKEYITLNKRLAELKTTAEVSKEEMGGFATGLSKMGKSGKIIASGFTAIGKGARIAAAGIKAFAASTIILLAVQAVMEAIMWLIDRISKAWDDFTGADTAKLVENFDGVAASLDNAKDKLEQFNKELGRDETSGAINQYDALVKKIEAVKQAAIDAGNGIKEFAENMANTKDIDFGGDGFESDAWFNSDGTVKNMEEFKKRYNLLVKAVAQGVDEIEAKTGEGDWYLTAGDAATDLANMQLALIGRIQKQVSQIDFSNPSEAYKKFMNIVNDETNASALANLDELFPEDEWQKGLNKRIDTYRDFVNQLEDLNAQLAAQQAEINRQIEDNNNAAIRDSYKRGQAQRKTAMERELADAGSNEELKASIRAKYRTQEWEATKSHNQQMANEAKANRQKALQRQYAAQQAEIDLMEEGLEKQKAILELQKKQAVDAAKEQGASKKTIANIVENYNRQILKLELEFTKNIEKLYKDRNKTLLDLELEYLAQLKEVDRSIWDRQMEIKQQLEDFNQQDVEFKLNFDIQSNPPIDEYVGSLVNYYRQLNSAQESYYERKKQLETEAENERYNREQDDEYDRYQERLQYYSEWLEQQNEVLRQALEDGLISQQKYDELEQENHQKANEYAEGETQKYLENITQMEKDHNQNLLEIERNYQEQRRASIKEGLDNIIGTYQEYFSEIEALGEKTTKRNTSEIGIINFKKEKVNLNNMKTQYEELMKDLAYQYADLQQKFNNNEISFNDFRLAKKELDSLSASIQDKYKEVENKLKNLFNTVVQSVMQATQQYVQAFSSIWSQISSLIEANLDEQERRLEREQEILEEEYDMLEEQYAKQEELVQKHTDRVSSIEDELKTARGDRREFLIDQLTKERDAQIKALETEREIEKEKQQNQKKQQQLEKQQEALEKKRWEQNKKNQIVQATINTFTAVTNALAVQPWFVGLALSAVALGLGMANVAKIKAQKYYAEGGLLNGKPHSQGGIKIPGTNIEVEGDEYVINKTTTRQNLPLIEYINSKKRPITREDLINFYDDGKTRLISRNLTNKFAEGGQLPTMQDVDVRDLVNYQQPQDNAQYVVSVVDIINATENVKQIQTLAGVNQ